MAHSLAQGTSREAEATSTELLRVPYSRSSFERVGHEVGREYIQRRRHVEQKLIEAFEIPTEARSISVSVDRVAVPMEEPREAPPGKPTKKFLQHVRANSRKVDVSEQTRAILEEADSLGGRER